MTRICNVLSFDTEKEAMEYAVKRGLKNYTIQFSPDMNCWEVEQILYI